MDIIEFLIAKKKGGGGGVSGTPLPQFNESIYPTIISSFEIKEEENE